MVSLAYAEAPKTAAQQPAPFMNFVPIVGMLAIFYFFMIRPQQKRTKEHGKMLDQLQKGDMVITSGGIYGTVISVGDKTMELKVADNVKIKITKSSVSDKVNAQESSNGKLLVQAKTK